MQQALVEARKKDMRELRRQDREYRRKAKELELDTLYERRAEVAKERLKNVTHFERKSSKYESPLFSNLEKAIEHGSSDAIADTVEAKSISEMLAEQQREKEELSAQEAPIRERRQKIIRTEADLIQMLIYKELEEGLTEEEQMKVEDYMMSDVGEMQVKAWRQVATYEHAKRAKNG
jgi:hypothetical protein